MALAANQGSFYNYGHDVNLYCIFGTFDHDHGCPGHFDPKLALCVAVAVVTNYHTVHSQSDS